MPRLQPDPIWSLSPDLDTDTPSRRSFTGNGRRPKSAPDDACAAARRFRASRRHLYTLIPARGFDMAASSASPSASPRSGDSAVAMVEPPLLTKLYYRTTVTAIKTVLAPMQWYKGWQDYFQPPELRPDLVKKYECRPYLPVRYVANLHPHSLPPTYLLGPELGEEAWRECFHGGGGLTTNTHTQHLLPLLVRPDLTAVAPHPLHHPWRGLRPWPPRG